MRESLARDNLETAFVRAETVLKLLQDVLPRHHPRWHAATPEQLTSAQQVRPTLECRAGPENLTARADLITLIYPLAADRGS